MIDRCVRCGYSLKGLPAVHRCPECGRENDRESVAVREPRLTAKLLAVAGTVIIVAWAALVWMRGGSWSYPMIAPAALVLAGAWIQMSRRARLVVVSHRGLELIDEFSEVRSYPMQNVADAQWNSATGAIGVTDRQGRAIITVPKNFLGSKRANWKIVLAIKTLVARHETAVPPGSAAPAD